MGGEVATTNNTTINTSRKWEQDRPTEIAFLSIYTENQLHHAAKGIQSKLRHCRSARILRVHRPIEVAAWRWDCLWYPLFAQERDWNERNGMKHFPSKQDGLFQRRKKAPETNQRRHCMKALQIRAIFSFAHIANHLVQFLKLYTFPSIVFETDSHKTARGFHQSPCHRNHSMKSTFSTHKSDARRHKDSYNTHVHQCQWINIVRRLHRKDALMCVWWDLAHFRSSCAQTEPTQSKTPGECVQIPPSGEDDETSNDHSKRNNSTQAQSNHDKLKTASNKHTKRKEQSKVRTGHETTASATLSPKYSHAVSRNLAKNWIKTFSKRTSWTPDCTKDRSSAICWSGFTKAWHFAGNPKIGSLFWSSVAQDGIDNSFCCGISSTRSAENTSRTKEATQLTCAISKYCQCHLARSEVYSDRPSARFRIRFTVVFERQFDEFARKSWKRFIQIGLHKLTIESTGIFSLHSLQKINDMCRRAL